MTARETALSVLLDVAAGETHLSAALEHRLGSLPDARDRAFAQDLCYGTLRWQPRLRTILNRLLSKPLKQKDRDVELILILGLYQLEYTRVPPYAAVAASVESIGARRKAWARGLGNAVLRRFIREREHILATMPSSDEARYAHPRWMAELIRSEWPEQWRSVLEANNTHAPMTLRVNRLKTSRDHYLHRLEAQEISAQPCDIAPDAVALSKPRDVLALPGFPAGEVSVQDEAAQLAAHLLAPATGDRVLDACGAPGGKTAHLLEAFPRMASLTSVDISPQRAARIGDTLTRLGLEARVVEGDAGRPRDWWDGQTYQRILLDAPCSATGVIRRHPDVKLLRTRGQVSSLAAEQLRLLTNLWPLLAPGGTLLYATCSVLPDENERPIADFLRGQSDALSLPLDAPWGHARSIGRQILPGERGMDGFYYALLKKHPDAP